MSNFQCFQPEDSGKFGASKSLAVVFLALIQKSYGEGLGFSDYMLSMRILQLTLAFFAFVCFSMYNASLTSVFTFSDTNPPIRNMEVCINIPLKYNNITMTVGSVLARMPMSWGIQ